MKDEHDGPLPFLLAQDRKRKLLRSTEEVFELPDVGSKSPVQSLAVHNWTALYAAGGNAVSPALPSVPTRQRVDVLPKGGYTFDFVAGDKVKAYTTAGVEVVATTDLSALSPLALVVWGTRPAAHDLFSADSSQKLSAVRLAVGAAVLFSATNYWRFRVQVVRAQGSEVLEIGSLSTAAQSLAVGVRYDVFAAAGPSAAVDFRVGDLVRVRVEETGTAPALVQPVVTVRRRRE